MKAVIKIDGMHCPSCAATIDERLEEIEGVSAASSSVSRARVKMKFDEQRVRVEDLRAAIDELGYRTREEGF